MKIIKHGKMPEPVNPVRQFECPHCGCAFEARNKDCTEIGCKNTGGKLKIVAYGLRCPECGERLAFYV